MLRGIQLSLDKDKRLVNTTANKHSLVRYDRRTSLRRPLSSCCPPGSLLHTSGMSAAIAISALTHSRKTEFALVLLSITIVEYSTSIVSVRCAISISAEPVIISSGSCGWKLGSKKIAHRLMNSSNVSCSVTTCAANHLARWTWALASSRMEAIRASVLRAECWR